MDQRGHIVGSHTLSHPNIAQISASDAQHELSESRWILEKQLGKAVRHFSYPNPILKPHWTARTSEIAARAGYLTAVTSDSGGANRECSAHALVRLSVPHHVDELAWNLEGASWAAHRECHRRRGCVSTVVTRITGAGGDGEPVAIAWLDQTTSGRNDQMTDEADLGSDLRSRRA